MSKTALKLTKKELKEIIDNFPEKSTIDQLIERFIPIDKIEKQNEQPEKRQLKSEEELDKEIEKWGR